MLNQSLQLVQKQRLSLIQKQTMQMILGQVQLLRHPAPQWAIKGLDGIKHAHEFLQKKNLRGILVGSLLQSLWSRMFSEPCHYSNQHKDVDVIVLDDVPIHDGSWEGIDWWWPVTKIISYSDRHVIERKNVPVLCLENRNGCVFSFRIGNRNDLLLGLPQAGLYIPNSLFYAAMRVQEARSIVDYQYGGTNVEIENMDKVLTAIERKAMKDAGSNVNNLLVRAMGKEYLKYILHSRYQSGAFIAPVIEEFPDIGMLKRLVNFECLAAAPSQQDIRDALA